MILTTTVLAISFTMENDTPRYYLNNENDSSELVVQSFITPANLYSVILTQPFEPLLRRLDWHLKVKLNMDQLIAVVYFYLATQPFSPLVVRHWLEELGCMGEYSERIVDILNQARLEKPEFEPSDVLHLRKSLVNDSDLPSITTILEDCMQGMPLKWKYDNLALQNEYSYKVINLGKLNETAFLVEDHGCMVVGFSVTITELVQLLSGYKPAALPIICAAVPLPLRDHYSVGRLVLEHPEVIEQLEQTCFSDAIFHGLLPNGNLSTFESGSLINHGTTIPLFLKLIK